MLRNLHQVANAHIPTKPRTRALLFTPGEGNTQRIEQTLAREQFLVQVVRSVVDVIAALTPHEGPRPQVLVVDVDALHPAEILELHKIRDEGWCGAIFALGRVPGPLRASLGIERVLAGPDECRPLRAALANLGFDTKTRRIPILATTT